MRLDCMRLLLSLLLLSCSFAFAQDGLIAYVSKVGEIEHDLVVVTPQGKEQTRLGVLNAERDLRVLSHSGYFIVLKDYDDDTLFLFDARSGRLEPVALPPELSGTLDPVASTPHYILFARTFDWFLLDIQRATLHALEFGGPNYATLTTVLSPDERFVLASTAGGGLWQFSTRDPTAATLIDATAVTAARFVDATTFMYIAEDGSLKRASTQRAITEDLAQDVFSFYPTRNSVLFSKSEGGLYSLEPTSLESRLIHPFTEPVEVVWADANHALGKVREDNVWFYVTLATGDLLMLDALDGALPVAGLRPESDAALFSDSLDIAEPRTFWGLELATGRVTRVGDFNGWTGPAGDGGLLLNVFDRTEFSTELYRLDAHGATFLLKALSVGGALSPDGRFVAVDARIGRPDTREAKGLTLLMDADGTLVGELGQGGYGVFWLSEPE